MKQKLISLISSLSLLLSLLVLSPVMVLGQAVVFTPTCSGSAASDTASLNAQITSISTNTGKIQIPYKSNSAQRCKFNTASIPANVTLDNWIGSGIEVVAGQTLTVLGTFTAPTNKQSFYGTGTIALASQTVHSAWFPGSDVGAKINAADAALGVNKGRIEVQGGGTISTQTIVSANRTLYMGAGTYIATTTVPTILAKANVTIEGEGDNTIIQESGQRDSGLGVNPLVVIANYYGLAADALNGTLGGENITIRNLKIIGHTPISVTDGAISSGTAILTSATASFTSNMVGYTVGVYGAGTAPTNNLIAFINSVDSSTQVTLSANASATVSGARVFGAHFDSTSQTITLGNCHDCTVDNLTLENTHTIGIQSGGGSDTAAGAGTGTKTVTAASNTTPIVITTSAPHGYPFGEQGIRVKVASVGGTTAANGYFDITPLTTTTFSLNFSVGNGAYTSGGTVKQLGYAKNIIITNNRLIGVASQNLAAVNSRVVQISNNIIEKPGQPFGPGVVAIDVEPNANDTVRDITVQGNTVDSTESPIDSDNPGGPKVLHGIAVQNTVNVVNYGPVHVSGNTIVGTLSGNAVGNYISGSGIFVGAAQQTYVKGNVIKRTQDGIWVIGGGNNYIENNSLTSVGAAASNWAIRMEDTTGNYVKGNQLYIDPDDGLATNDREIREIGTSDNNTYMGNYAETITLLGAGSTIPSNVNASLQSPKFCFTGLNCEYTGAGSPEGVVTGTVGSTYRNTSNGDFYRKTSGSGNTGWTASVGGGTVTSVTGTSPIASTGGATPAISLNDTAVTPGSYTNANITVDAKGRLTAAANGSASAVCGSTTEILFNLAGVCGTSPLFVWDNVNKRQGINVAAPVSTFHLSSNLAGSDGGITVDQFNAGPTSTVNIRGSRGTQASPTALQSGDFLGRLLFSGYDGTNYGVASPAGIAAVAQQTFTPTAHGNYLLFSTAADGSVTRTERMRLNDAGLDVAAHMAIGDGATINQIVGVSGVGPTLLNVRESILTFPVTDSKAHGIMSYYTLDPNNAQPVGYEAHGIQSILQVTNGNTQTFAGELDALTGTAIFGGDTSLNRINALWADTQISGTATVATATAVTARLRTFNSGGTITNAIAGLFQTTNDSAKTMTSARGVVGQVTNSSTGSISTAYGFQALTPTNTGGGAIGTIAGLHIQDHSAVPSVTTRYNLHSSGSTAVNYFEGIVRGKIQDISGQVVNCKAYGALGDGTTEDTVAINTCISAAAGSIAYLPEGVYVVEGISAPSADTIIRGAGKGNTTLKRKNNSTINTSIILLTNPRITVEDLTFDGNCVNPTGTTCTNQTVNYQEVFVNTPDVTLDNVSFINIQTVGVWVLSTGLRLRVTNSDFTGLGHATNGAAFGIQNNPIASGTVDTSGTAVTWISGALFPTAYSMVGERIQIAGVSYIIASVTDSTHLTLLTTAGVQSGATSLLFVTAGMVVEGCTFTNFRLNGVITDGGYHTIRNNIFNGNHWSTASGGGQVAVGGSATGWVSITDNEFNVGSGLSNTQTSCIEVSVSAIITGNRCDGGGFQNFGIAIQGGTHITVSNNLVKGFGEGLHVDEAVFVTDYLNIQQNDFVSNTAPLSITSTGTHNKINGIVQEVALGAATASATALTLAGNLQHVTGTTTITSISTTGMRPGRYTLVFDGVLTFTKGSNLKLQSNFVTAADSVITLDFDGTNFYEVGRSAASALPGSFTTVTASSLTSGRVPFASTAGLLVDDADLTFATDTLTATKFSGPTVGVVSGAAAAGIVGEEITAALAPGSAVSLTSTVSLNITNITLTPGDYELWGTLFFVPAATTTNTSFNSSISTTSNTLSSTVGANVQNGAGGAVFGGNAYTQVVNRKLLVTVNTDVYLVANATFGTSTMTAYGTVRARRMR